MRRSLAFLCGFFIVCGLLLVREAISSDFTISVNLNGSGSGSVNSIPTGEITCTYPPQSGKCSSSLSAGTSLSLFATPSSNSFLGGWDGSCSSCNDLICPVIFDDNKDCNVTFTTLPPVLIDGSPLAYYTHLQDAFNTVSNVTSIKSRDVAFNENLVATPVGTVILRGGYDSSFSNQEGYSVLHGSFTIKTGKVVVDRLIVSTMQNPTLAVITVTPTNPSIVLGATQQFTAIGAYSDNTATDLTSLVTWGSSNNIVATISNAVGSKGLSSPIGTGTTTISASYDNVSGTTELVVSNQSDEQAIRGVFAAMKTAMEAHNLNDIMVLFDINYMNNVTDRTTQQSHLAEVVPTVNTFEYTISNITITGIKATVNASITVTFNNGKPPITFSEPLLSSDGGGLGMGYFNKTNDKWLIYGNQVRANAYIQTGHNTTPGDDHYFLRIRTESTQQISSVTCSGPYIPVTTLTPDPVYGGYKAFITPFSLPPVGSVYTFTISFSDSTQQILQDTVKAYVPISPSVTVIPGQGTATFKWSDVSQTIPNAEYYWLQIQRDYDDVFWEMDDLPLTKTSAVFNEDGTASDSLKSGQTYLVFISVFNMDGDYAYQFVPFTMP